MANAKTTRASLEELVALWLQESGLTQQQLPGELLSMQSRYRMHYFDIDGERVPECDIHRLFETKHGFGAVAEPKKDAPKYLYPSGERPRVFYPPQPRPRFFNWREWAGDPTKPKYITEGWKKAASATLLGLHCVALNGCWGF
jgi:hypothetical protein